MTRPAVSQFAGLKSLRDKPPAPPQDSPTELPSAPAKPTPRPALLPAQDTAPRRQGRPRGKSSDPRYEATNLVLTTKVKRAVSAQLDLTRDIVERSDVDANFEFPEESWWFFDKRPRDLSAAVELALEHWLKETEFLTSIAEN